MPKKPSTSIDTAQGFKELEEIAAWFEKGEADIDKGLEKFERAMTIADALKKRLAMAENRIKEIQSKYEE